MSNLQRSEPVKRRAISKRIIIDKLSRKSESKLRNEIVASYFSIEFNFFCNLSFISIYVKFTLKKQTFTRFFPLCINNSSKNLKENVRNSKKYEPW